MFDVSKDEELGEAFNWKNTPTRSSSKGYQIKLLRLSTSIYKSISIH